MELADARVTKLGNQLHVTHGEDKDLYVEFDMDAIHQPYESEQKGHPIYKDVPHITIMFPGDRTKSVRRPAKLKGDASTPSDPERFPRQWAAFQNQTEQAADGQPLEHWPMVNKSDVRMLKDMGIRTVEALAALSDANLTFLGAHMYREKAKTYLAQAVDGSAISRLVSENETLKLETERQKQQLVELGAAVAELQKKTPNKRASAEN